MPILTTSTWYDRYSTDLIAAPTGGTIDLPLSYNNAMINTDAATVRADKIFVGENNTNSDLWRSIIRIDWSSLPAGSTIVSAVLKMTPTLDRSGSDRTIYSRRVLRATVPAQITWNVYSTGNNWGTAGCSNSTTDYENTDLGSGTQPASPTINTEIDVITFVAAELQKLFDGTYTDYGIVLFVATQTNDLIQYADLAHATTAYRPRVVVEYLLP
jgi:hypothetical protein